MKRLEGVVCLLLVSTLGFAQPLPKQASLAKGIEKIEGAILQKLDPERPLYSASDKQCEADMKAACAKTEGCTEWVKKMREEKGIDAVLSEVCAIDPDGELGKMIKEKIELIKKRGWIK